MAASFPVTFPSAVTSTPTTTLSSAQHNDNLHVKDRDEIIAAQRKIGLGSSVASGTTVLLGTGGTQSAWGQITSGYIAPGAVTAAALGTTAITQRLPVALGTSSPTTTSGTAVTIADPVGTIVTQGGDIYVHGHCAFTSNAANAIVGLHVRLDSGTFQGIAFGTPDSTSQWLSLTGFHVFQSVSAGTHTLTLGFSTNSGTLTAQGTGRRLMQFEVRA